MIRFLHLGKLTLATGQKVWTGLDWNWTGRENDLDSYLMTHDRSLNESREWSHKESASLAADLEISEKTD